MIGDIHGCIKTLRSLLEEELKIEKSDQVYFVGDYIDRGPSSKEVLDYIMQFISESYQFFPVKGNHEDLLLKAYFNSYLLRDWLNNGAENSLQSFHIPRKLHYQHEDVKLIPNKYINFLKNLPYYYELDDAIISHAGLNFDLLDPRIDLEAMLWLRSFQYDGSKINDKKLFHGHTPTSIESLEMNIADPGSKVINIDTGCVYTRIKSLGILSAIDMDSLEVFSVRNREGE